MPPAGALPPEAWQQDMRYLFGCDLFNHGFFWEAHEAWEACWMQSPPDSERARFLQALIQAANALLKQRMQRPHAVARLLAEVTRLFAGLGQTHFMGVDLARWHAALLCHVTQAGPWPHLTPGRE